jgi:hypothetical protein
LKGAINKKRPTYRQASFRIRIVSFYYALDLFLVIKEAKSINPPNISIKTPDIRFTFEFNEMEYISLPFVDNPNSVKITPKMPNIRPIGNFISNPILLFFIGYQNIILKIIAMIPTIQASAFGF